MNSDFKDLLVALNENEVRYLVVGDYAVILHAEPRYTADLDIWVEPSPDNASRLMRAFSAFGLPLINIEEDDFAREGVQYQIGVVPCAIDFPTAVPGAEFASSWERRCVVTDENVKINYLSKADLIATKRKAGRPKDLHDLSNLEST